MEVSADNDAIFATNKQLRRYHPSRKVWRLNNARFHPRAGERTHLIRCPGQPAEKMGCGTSKERYAAPPPVNTPTAQPQAEPQPRTTGTGQARQPEPAKPTNSLQEPGNSLEEAAKECLRAHEAEAGISPHSGEKWAQSWDGGVSFHYGQPGTDDIPADSARHRAEAEAFRCVAAQDAVDAPDQASREAGMVNRGVFVWWLLLYAGTVDPKLTTAEVVAKHVKPMTARRRCRFVECADGCDDCCSARAVVDAYLASDFCLVPPGDTPTRRAFFDALLTGCVPVVKTRRTADYAWYLCRRRR